MNDNKNAAPSEARGNGTQVQYKDKEYYPPKQICRLFLFDGKHLAKEIGCHIRFKAPRRIISDLCKESKERMSIKYIGLADIRKLCWLKQNSQPILFGKEAYSG